MTAKEMFEALGYEQIKETKTCIEYTTNKGYAPNERIKFSKTRKVFWRDGRSGQGNLYGRPITIDEYKAIHQQLIELGWIE